MKYIGEYTREISFPLGGIGSGCIGLSGDGTFVDWEIFNRPNKGSRNGFSHIAVKAVNSKGIKARVLNGDKTKDFMGIYKGNEPFYTAGYGLGADCYSMAGFPHFKDNVFSGEFPFANINFKDADFPANISLMAFNPFIPLDSKNSSIPAAFFEVEINNTSDEVTEYQVAFSLCNPFSKTKNKTYKKNNLTLINLKYAEFDRNEIGYGDLTVATDCTDTAYQTYWYRGGWKDSLVSFWNDFTAEGDLKDRTYDEIGITKPDGSDYSTLVGKVSLKPNETRSIKFILSWNIPNNYNYWSKYADENGKDITWKNYYATVFEDSLASAEYSLKNWSYLYKETLAFKEALFSSTLDSTFLDAISANLSVLKSPTVLRLEDGSIWGWEGVFEKRGSCEGTCQHVWNYAYAMCFLFPDLERGLRDAEIKYSTLDNGKSVFRIKIPYEREQDDFIACVDGQMGLVFKCYREWKICGDDSWLKAKWEKIKKLIDFAWSEENIGKWDADKDGILEGRQHHTLDMELYGPSSWLEGMYLLGLKAGFEMAEYLGETEKANEYKALFENGYEYMKNNLFNGEYFIQKVDLKDKSVIERFEAEDYWNNETEEIKYQISEGSAIDQMLAQWHSELIGLGNIFDKDQVDTALNSMMKYNFKESLRDFTNPWRVFALNDEGGTVICEYPENVKKPSIPIPYCEEIMTGFEYSFAGLLASKGKVADAVKVVKVIRDRYDGKKRNPWNEIECGSNYARSMASYALLPIMSGFEFDTPHNHIGFDPIEIKCENSFFWCLGTAWGKFTIQNNLAIISILHGEIVLSSVGMNFAEKVNSVTVDGEEIDYNFQKGKICFDKKLVKSNITVKL